MRAGPVGRRWFGDSTKAARRGPAAGGAGNAWRVSHELLMLGIRGDDRAWIPDLASWGKYPRGRHSEKPEAVRGMIERVSPGPYLELLGRKLAEGWTVFGDQVKANSDRGIIKRRTDCPVALRCH